MRCYICQTVLTESSIQWNNDHKDWDPCPTCLIEINEVFSDPPTEEEITAQLEAEWGEYIKDDQKVLTEQKVLDNSS